MTAARPLKLGAGDHAYFGEGLSGLMDSLPAGTARSLIHVFNRPSCQDLALAELAESIESRDEQPEDLSAEVAALVDELRAYCLEATSHRRAGRLRDAEKGLDNRQRPEAQLGADHLREFVKAGPSSRTAASMAAVLSTSLRRAFRLRFPGLQTLPWS